jgi:hypothetical protein
LQTFDEASNKSHGFSALPFAKRFSHLRKASRPATLNDGAGALTDCATLQEAVLAWHRLEPEQKIRATVKVIGGPVYTVKEIERLHYGPKPGSPPPL